MTAEAVLATRKEELRRRVEGLPAEVQAWRERTLNDLDSNAHHSQLEAIKALAAVFTAEQRALLAQLDPYADAAAFQATVYDLVQNVIRSHKMWDFFRDKLDLRFSPAFKEVLWVADTVAWDCYGPVLEEARQAGIVKKAELREPPLCYLTAEYSPMTWVRGSRPIDMRNYPLGTAELPIPVIEMPWDHVQNPWEFLALHHEVAHDLEADLKLREPLKAELKKQLEEAGATAAQVGQWLGWQGEVFADLVALQLAGPAFAEALMALLVLPAAMVLAARPGDPHPAPYLRILMNAAYIPALIAGNPSLEGKGQEIRDRWMALYGEQTQFSELVDQFPVVFKALVETPLPDELKGKTVRDLAPYKLADHLRITGAAGYMKTGDNKPGKQLRPRHVVSAARLAVTGAAVEGALSGKLLDGISARTLALVRENAEVGLRAANDSTPHREFIEGFAKYF